MKLHKLISKLGTALLTMILPVHAMAEAEILGKVEVQGLHFFQDKPSSSQQNFYGSIAVEPEYFMRLNAQSEIKAKLFYRKDNQSPSRTHGDIRELMYYYFEDDWELHAGIGKVFWGVTESRHLVDSINQIDNIESQDDEQRLGQPMVQAKWIKDWGTIDLFLLPYFREVDFGSSDLRPQLGLDLAKPLYQDSAKRQHVDIALRWSHTIDNSDIGISYFNGTQRTPILNSVLVKDQPKIQPVYVQTQTLGVDLQHIHKDWLLKLESLYRSNHQYSQTDGFTKAQSKAIVTGFEYTFYGLNDSAHDLGLIGEYLFDEDEKSTPFQNDWMTGIRWTWNDVQSTEWLLGVVIDLDDHTQMWQLEASRRIAESWKTALTAQFSTNVDAQNTFAQQLKNHDRLTLTLDYFF